MSLNAIHLSGGKVSDLPNIMSNNTPKFRIYPPLGVARLGNGPAEKDKVVFSPEVPWANLYETDLDYLTDDGEIKKQAQRFYIYECDDFGKPIRPISTEDYDIQWSVEVANKKPYWYVFNNCLDLSIISDNYNLSPTFYEEAIAPAKNVTQRNPNTLDQSQRDPGGHDYRKELVNSPPKVSVDASCIRQVIQGQFPYPWGGESKLAKSMNCSCQQVNLGTIEYDEDGTLIFYAADGVDGNPSNYDAIASQEKAIYFSYNSQVNSQLVAFHNQAVTSTQYYGDGLFKHFGGVKNGPLRCTRWLGDRAVAGGARSLKAALRDRARFSRKTRTRN